MPRPKKTGSEPEPARTPHALAISAHVEVQSVFSLTIEGDGCILSRKEIMVPSTTSIHTDPDGSSYVEKLIKDASRAEAVSESPREMSNTPAMRPSTPASTRMYDDCNP
ncbi:hypothetical protein LTR17_012053 [Elasticomyces elasticus]|nr:hypothetical protein LTR17_012053 [Elasticomyces elasticus]